jgi:hypothetical protein
MVKKADAIFRGQVTAINSSWEGTGANLHISTFVTFNVLKTLKGTVSSPYTLQLLGGTVDGKTLVVVGMPKFNVGDINLLFVVNNGTQICPLVGMMHGYFRVQNQNGADIVLRSNGQALHGTSEIDAIHQKAVAADGLTNSPSITSSTPPTQLQDFENAIQQQVSAGP